MSFGEKSRIDPVVILEASRVPCLRYAGLYADLRYGLVSCIFRPVSFFSTFSILYQVDDI